MGSESTEDTGISQDNVTGKQSADENRLHGLRQEIDANIKAVECLLGSECQTGARIKTKAERELILALTKLQEAKMWVGKCLEAINSPFPEELRDEAK